MINIDELKKKIIYRSNYRGTKEMDNLLGAFTKKYINILNENDLLDLEKLLNIDDTNLYNFYNGFKTDVDFENNIMSTCYYIKILTIQKNDGGETGIRTQERVAPLPVFKTGAFNRSAISPLARFYK